MQGKKTLQNSVFRWTVVPTVMVSRWASANGGNFDLKIAKGNKLVGTVGGVCVRAIERQRLVRVKWAAANDMGK